MAKRTNYSNEFKFKVALGAIRGEETFDELAIKYNFEPLSKLAKVKIGMLNYEIAFLLYFRILSS